MRMSRRGRGDPAGARRVLFLCTGNYYRSRFAEIVFNHLAQAVKLNWRAESAGLAIERLDRTENAGNLSVYAMARLRILKLAADPAREPRSCDDAMLMAADRVIALHEAEHRVLVEARHPRAASRVVYWHVPDIDAADPQEALGVMETLVRNLVDDLLIHGEQP